MWLKECWVKSFEELRMSASGERWVPVERWVYLDMRVAGVLRKMITQLPYTDAFKRESTSRRKGK